MDDEKPFDLRDQFAMAAMQILLQQPTDSYKPLKGYTHGYSTEVISEFDLEQMERIALAAYKMADVMRKARLQAFG
jgi:hypothetical protein